MKLAISFMLLCVMVANNPLSAKEFVRGGNLGPTLDFLDHIEGHHGNLEVIEDKLDTLKANKQPIFDTEVIMEKVASFDAYLDNAWEDNDPSWKQNLG